MTTKKFMIWWGYPWTSNIKGYATLIGGPRMTITYPRSSLCTFLTDNQDYTHRKDQMNDEPR